MLHHNKHSNLHFSRVQHITRLTQHIAYVYRTEVRENLNSMGANKILQAGVYHNTKSREKPRRGKEKFQESREYIQKIISASKVGERDLNSTSSNRGLRPIVDTALIPILSHPVYKGHKPSNHICARIKSRIYTTESSRYHNTCHV